jgi:hypothetical protein
MDSILFHIIMLISTAKDINVLEPLTGDNSHFEPIIHIMRQKNLIQAG